MRTNLSTLAAAAVTAAVALGLVVRADGPPAEAARAITWEDAAPFHGRLQSGGLTAAGFPAAVDRLRRAHARRVREGDLDHLIFYLLQSTHFTSLPPIEPALSAKAFVERMDAEARTAFLDGGRDALSGMPPQVARRASALLRAIDAPGGDPRLMYFRELVNAAFPDRRRREAALAREYVRVVRFLYMKEFVAQRSASAASAVAELYRTRGLSTDTGVEAGFLVYQALGVMRALDAGRRVRRVLIVGPGLDLAPRTSLLEAGPPQSYQPWAVIDALLALGLSRRDDLEMVAADINPRVVRHLRRERLNPPTLRLVSELRQTETVTLSPEYRDYFAQLGLAIARPRVAADANSGDTARGGVGAPRLDGHLHKTIAVDPAVARALHAETLDIVTDRLAVPPFDLIVATNILPYFDDRELMLALVNVEKMLAPGGVFLHNESRPVMHDFTAALALPIEQSRHAIVASVRGAPPLVDSAWLHRKASRPPH